MTITEAYNKLHLLVVSGHGDKLLATSTSGDYYRLVTNVLALQPVYAVTLTEEDLRNAV